MVFLHVILSYLAGSIFRDPMLTCFWSIVAFMLLSPPLNCQQCQFRDNNAILGTRLRKTCYLSLFYCFKISVNKKFGCENFRTKSLPEIKLVRNFSFLMYTAFTTKLKVDCEYQLICPDIASTFTGGFSQCRGRISQQNKEVTILKQQQRNIKI